MDEASISVSFQPVGFSGLPGWGDDDHVAAFKAFQASAPYVIEHHKATFFGRGRHAERMNAFTKTCQLALQKGPDFHNEYDARQFFETNFTPFMVVHREPAGLLTGYYEPELPGSLQRSEKYNVPILARPADLVNLIDEADRGAMADQLTHARRAGPQEFVPYFTRREIDDGALAGQGLELLYLADPIDVFFLQVQGSGLIRLEDGRGIRVGYDGKNGHRYTSIGQHLIETAEFTPEEMSLQALKDWLRADAARAQAILWLNESYVFFRIIGDEHHSVTLGTGEIPLQPMRSLAVDTRHYDLGLPIYVCCPSADHISEGPWGFRRLMVAHDVGSAITGPERGDLFCGSGPRAGELAGVTKHAVNFFVLFPKEELDRSAPRQ